jgi:hypothetical protein
MPAPRISRNAGLAILIVVSLIAGWRIVSSGYAAWVSGGSHRPPVSFDVEAPDAHWRSRIARNPTDFPALLVSR